MSATDVARALRSLLGPLGFRVTLVEPRTERAIAEDGPSSPALDAGALGDRDAVVFTDHDAPDLVDDLARRSARPSGSSG